MLEFVADISFTRGMVNEERRIGKVGEHPNIGGSPGHDTSRDSLTPIF
jgi:hypothetical protein